MNKEILNIEDEDLRIKLDQLEKYKSEIKKLSEEQDSIYEKVVALFVNGDNDFAFDYMLKNLLEIVITICLLRTGLNLSLVLSLWVY